MFSPYISEFTIVLYNTASQPRTRTQRKTPHDVALMHPPLVKKHTTSVIIPSCPERLLSCKERKSSRNLRMRLNANGYCLLQLKDFAPWWWLQLTLKITMENSWMTCFIKTGKVCLVFSCATKKGNSWYTHQYEKTSCKVNRALPKSLHPEAVRQESNFRFWCMWVAGKNHKWS